VELHDDLGQRLTGIAFMLKSLELNLKKRKVEEAASAAKIHTIFSEAMNHAKDVARHLTSLNVQDETLSNSLKRLAAQVRGMFKIRCSFRSVGRIPSPPENTSQQLYKIAQEAVTNAIRHAKAKEVELKLSCNADKIVLSIRNTGLPFPSMKDQRPGVGLRIMNYRANLIDAKLELKHPRGGGTVVVCSVPVGS
jgi:signal transduction histidine kinase